MTAARTHTRYWHLLLLMRLVRLVPRPVLMLLSRAAGAAAFRALPRLRRAVIDNLAAVTGDRRRAAELAHRTFVNYCVYLIDCFPLSSHRVVSVRGGEHPRAALERGNGIILVTPHLGHWELAGIWLARNGFRLNVVSLEDEDPKTEALRNRMREEHGIRLLRVDPGSDAIASMVEMMDALKRNEIVAMLTDRPAAERSEEVPFFGRTARLPAGAFVLSWLTHAPVIPCYSVLDDRGYSLVTDPPVELDRTRSRAAEIRRGVEEMARRYEGYIRSHPDQWYNFYPYWNDQD